MEMMFDVHSYCICVSFSCHIYVDTWVTAVCECYQVLWDYEFV